jgi:site-specific DNA-cytosine methylase
MKAISHQMQKSTLNSIDLFCGAGGLSEGLKWTGFESLLGIDIWEPSIKSFAENHKSAVALTKDVSDISYKYIKKVPKIITIERGKNEDGYIGCLQFDIDVIQFCVFREASGFR